jgi:putative DNA primase/helicase
VTISEEEQDKQLLGRLKAEMPGILAWLVRGCLRWQKEGLTPAPEIVLQATKEYREEMDVIASFLAEKTSPLKGSTIPSTVLYEVYKAWTVANGNESETQMRFSLRLVERGIKKTRNSITGKVQWHDLTLRTD